MDASLLASATTTAAAHTIAVATSTTVATTIGRSGQRNGTHRGAVNVHGRLMYDEIVINDVWINAILSTLALSCAACVCLCFLYCKIQQWKHGGKTESKKSYVDKIIIDLIIFLLKQKHTTHNSYFCYMIILKTSK